MRLGAVSPAEVRETIRARPTELLIARYRVIPYMDRGGLLAAALEWARSPRAAACARPALRRPRRLREDAFRAGAAIGAGGRGLELHLPVGTEREKPGAGRPGRTDAGRWRERGAPRHRLCRGADRPPEAHRRCGCRFRHTPPPCRPRPLGRRLVGGNAGRREHGASLRADPARDDRNAPFGRRAQRSLRGRRDGIQGGACRRRLYLADGARRRTSADASSTALSPSRWRLSWRRAASPRTRRRACSSACSWRSAGTGNAP